MDHSGHIAAQQEAGEIISEIVRIVMRGDPAALEKAQSIFARENNAQYAWCDIILEVFCGYDEETDKFAESPQMQSSDHSEYLEDVLWKLDLLKAARGVDFSVDLSAYEDDSICIWLPLVNERLAPLGYCLRVFDDGSDSWNYSLFTLEDGKRLLQLAGALSRLWQEPSPPILCP